MNRTREDDIQEMCDQVLNALLLVDSSWRATCPFCGNDGFGEDIENIEHAHNCAYLIAKDLKINKDERTISNTRDS